ncbi:lysylphosphatidylglycerol synthase domain-containing protein [Escherichia coli]
MVCAIVCILVWGCPVALYADFLRSVLPPTGWAIFCWRGLSYRRRGGATGSLVCRSTHAAHSGIGLLMIIAVYLWFCAFAKHRHMTIKGQKLVLPSWKFALAQMLISSVNWMVMGAIIWLLLGQSVNYFFVLGVLLVSSIAGVIVHIPAGIGVLEAVFIALLAGEHTSKGTIIAALLAYRVLYYFIPLLLALICYLLLESQAKKLRAKNEAAM